MRTPIFLTLDQTTIATKCSEAKARILLVTPGITTDVADALVGAKERHVTLKIVLDNNENAFRLGYGEIQAVRRLYDEGVIVEQSPNLRVGILLVDHQGWSFSPIPLSVEGAPHGGMSYNAISLTKVQQDAIAESFGLALADSQPSLFSDPKPPEIGSVQISNTEIKTVEASLEQAPPLPFDLQRQVRVFQPYIQYVELSLEGAALRRQTVTLSPALAPLARNTQVQQRLRTTYQLISENSKIDDKHLHDELNKIRKDFTHPVKTLGGSVMLRGKQGVLEKRLAELEGKIETYKATLRKSLEKEVATSRDQLKRELLPLVRSKPPSALVNGCLGEKPTRDEADRWLQSELEKAFPQVDTLIGQIELKKVYKDVTFTSLNHPELKADLKRAFPAIEWEKPFDEYAAARASQENI